LLKRAVSNDCRKTNTKVISSTNHNRSKERNEPVRLKNGCKLFKAREKSRVQGAIGFGVASHWLKN